ncbi:hypothetical protein ACROYT_G028519 [Oculina patagonica]
MEGFYHFVCLACLLSSVLWTVKGTYYVKPTGRYEITEIPLPSSVIEQINKNNVQVTPTGVSIQTVAIEQLPQAPQPAAPPQPCPPPSTCPCPCPQPSSSGNPLYLRPLPKTNNETNAHCASLCICLCIGGSFPPGVSPPIPVQPPKSNATGPNPVVTSPLLNRSATTPLSSASSATKSTPSILTTSSSISHQTANTVTCPGIAGCSSSRSPEVSFSRTTQTGSSATPAPTLIPPMLPVAQGPKQKSSNVLHSEAKNFLP